MQADHILDTLILTPINISSSPLTQTSLHSSTSPQLCSLPRQHDAIWFFGDLNYRLRGTSSKYPKWSIPSFDLQKWAVPNPLQALHWILASLITAPSNILKYTSNLINPAPSNMLKRSQVLEWISDVNISSLMGYDELAHLRAHSHSSLGIFEEAPITFLPSYKLDLKSSSMPRPYSKSRLPSYCDRILYHKLTDFQLGCIYYDCISNYNLSDHHPIVGQYHFEVRKSTVKKEVVWQDVLHKRILFILNVNAYSLVLIITLLVAGFVWNTLL